MLKIGVLVSGGGTNLQAIIDSIEAGYIKNARIEVVVASKAGVYALERAAKHGIDCAVISKKSYETEDKFYDALIGTLEEHNVDLVVLAGFMTVLGGRFIKHYENKIINIHPALLPSFPGRHGIDDAYNYGVKVTGVTIHFVNDGVDSGKIIAQEPVRIEDDDSLDSLEVKIHAVEHKLYPKTLQKLIKEGVFKS